MVGGGGEERRKNLRNVRKTRQLFCIPLYTVQILFGRRRNITPETEGNTRKITGKTAKNVELKDRHVPIVLFKPELEPLLRFINMERSLLH